MLYENGEIDPNTGIRTKGDKNVLLARTSYMIGVINLGVIVQSTYLNLRDNESPQKMMTYLYDTNYRYAIKRI